MRQITLIDCAKAGTHLVTCDEDGYCNVCGYQDGAVPETVPEILDGAAEYLDLLDRAAVALAKQQGTEYERGDTVQTDLRLLAEWFRDHPEEAFEAMTYVQREGRQ